MTDLGLFAMGLLMLAGQIIMLLLWQAGWFKKERFKMEKANVMAQNKLTIRQMEKNMGLSKSKNPIPTEAPGVLSTIGNILPMIQGLKPEQLGDLIDIFVNRGYADEEDVKTKPVDWLMDFAGKNPDLVKGFVEGITRPKQDQGVTIYES